MAFIGVLVLPVLLRSILVPVIGSFDSSSALIWTFEFLSYLKYMTAKHYELFVKTDTVFKLFVIVKQIEAFKSIFDKIYSILSYLLLLHLVS